jgi:hypothetical protein
MSSNRLTPEQKQEWADRVENCRVSGKSSAEWCRENNVGYHKFLYWKWRFTPSPQKQTSPSASAFVEIVEDKSNNSGITIECKDLRIQLTKQFDPSTLKSLVALLRGF